MHFLKALKDTPPFVSGLLIGFLLAITTYALADSHFQSELFSQWATFIGAGATLIAGILAWLSLKQAQAVSEAKDLLNNAELHVEAILSANHKIFVANSKEPLDTTLAKELARASLSNSPALLKGPTEKISGTPREVASQLALVEAATKLSTGYVTLFLAASQYDKILGDGSRYLILLSRHRAFANRLDELHLFPKKFTYLMSPMKINHEHRI
ncbi:hypothetical protein [Thioclava sp. GXIMD4215]|uniref:hypothetical protein n=1 Tax=Thioclava sp. GXIMD4215 TaxID=3131928 RepID=UPI00324AB75F